VKIRVTMKDPDSGYDAVQDAVRAGLKGSGLPEDEQELLFESRVAKANEALGKWMRYGEYLDVEFDTESGTAVVLPAKG
jgi:hypothetical protein